MNHYLFVNKFLSLELVLCEGQSHLTYVLASSTE